MKVLNAYCGLGGNRWLWKDVEVTAIEINETIASYYKDHFPQDTLIVGDAHEYIRKNYSKFDFIWSSFPCPTHSRARFWGHSKSDPVYPDMGLYQEIIFLQHHHKGKWVVENVNPYYQPIIEPTAKIGRHVFWANFKIGSPEYEQADIKNGNRREWQDLHGIDIEGYSFDIRTDKILRNCVHPRLGKYILDRARDIIVRSDTEQTTLF